MKVKKKKKNIIERTKILITCLFLNKNEMERRRKKNIKYKKGKKLRPLVLKEGRGEQECREI